MFFMHFKGASPEFLPMNKYTTNLDIYIKTKNIIGVGI